MSNATTHISATIDKDTAAFISQLAEKEKRKFSPMIDILLQDAVNLRKINLSQVLSVAIGEASMCWSRTPKGTFNSNRASEIVDEIISKIKEGK